MKEIPLTKEKVALVDDADYEYLSQWKWHFHGGYAARVASERGGGKQTVIFMHNEIMKPPAGFFADHKRSNEKLNCQRENLRLGTRSQNNANRPKARTNKTGFKGVYPKKGRKYYVASITFAGHSIHLGCFQEPEEAARAYDAKATELFGEFAKTNF